MITLMTWGYIINKPGTHSKGVFYLDLPKTSLMPVWKNKPEGQVVWTLITWVLILLFTWTFTWREIIYIQSKSLRKFLEHVLSLKAIVLPPNSITYFLSQLLFFLSVMLITHSHHPYSNLHTLFFSGLLSAACCSCFFVLFAILKLFLTTRLMF